MRFYLNVFKFSSNILQGKEIYAWFKDQFTKVLDNYDENFKQQFNYDPSTSLKNTKRKPCQENGTNLAGWFIFVFILYDKSSFGEQQKFN